MSGQISENTVLTELSGLLDRPVSAGVTARARRHLLDWMGCAIAGAAEPAGLILRQSQYDTPSGQAFCWGGLGNILEMDDVDKRALLHPGPSIIPAALATGRDVGSTADAFLTAIVKGYEATIRLGRAVGSGHYAVWHNTGTCGAIGAAVASSALLGATRSVMAHAMALAMSQSTGLWQTRHDPESMGKQLHTAHAARAGVDAARLAVAGFRGPLDILEGEQGFFAATCPDGDPMRVLSDRESDWYIHQVSFKPWPACRHAHAAIDAALSLRAETDWTSDAPMRVETYADALKFCDKETPRTVLEAKFSLQHAVAVTLLRGAPTLRDFAADALQQPEIVTVRQRVEVAAIDEFDAVYPARFGARVSIGDRSVTVPDALGDPEHPLSDAQIADKAGMLMRAGGVAVSDADRMIAYVLNDLSTLSPVSGFLEEVLA